MGSMDQDFTKKIGFTGTRRGMSCAQIRFLHDTLVDIQRSSVCYAPEFHHGMCIGADAEANIIALSLGIPTTGHPPIDRRFMSHSPVIEIRPPENYLVRNHNIVDECGVLIVAPEGPEVVRSGTWATKRYADRKNKQTIILPWEDRS